MCRYCVFAIAAALALAGCSTVQSAAEARNAKFDLGGSSASSKPSDSSWKGLSGSYKGEIELGAADSNDPGAALAKGMGDMFAGMMSLEFPEAGRFKMSMMGLPVEGSATLDGNRLTLTPETMMGMKPEELEKLNKDKGAANAGDMKPMSGEVSDGGATIRLIEDGKTAKDGVLVFKRKADESKKEIVDKTSGDEKGLVGTWKGEVELGAGATDEDKTMAQVLANSLSLKLNADRTFALNMMVEMLGEWTLTGDRIELQPTKMMGMEMSDEDKKKNEPLVGSVSGNGTMISVAKAGEHAKLIFRKS